VFIAELFDVIRQLSHLFVQSGAEPVSGFEISCFNCPVKQKMNTTHKLLLDTISVCVSNQDVFLFLLFPFQLGINCLQIRCRFSGSPQESISFI
jgi:hypothetical protein